MPHTPVTFEQLRPIGHIIKTFGYEGDYIIYSNYGEAIEDLDFVFVEIDTCLSTDCGINHCEKRSRDVGKTHSPLVY